MKTKMTRSEIMQKIKSKDTQPELILRKKLWEKGFRYRKNVSSIFGKPDIAFKRKKIAIFCDSEFWHGKLYLDGLNIPKNNQEYWEKKFIQNIKRDEIVNQTLSEEGWIVLRFWEKDIKNNIEFVVAKIEEAFQEHQAPTLL